MMQSNFERTDANDGEDDDDEVYGEGEGEEEGDDFDANGVKVKGRSRRELPAKAVTILKDWLLSEEHFTHPYPTSQDQAQLMRLTGIGKKQLKNWFTNARRRIWKPLIKQHEDAHLNAGAPGGGIHNVPMPPDMDGRGRGGPIHGHGIGRIPHEKNPNWHPHYPPPPPPPGPYGQPYHGRPDPSRDGGYTYENHMDNRGQHGLHSDHSTNSFSNSMPRAPSVGYMGENIKKTDSMAFLEVILKDAASDSQNGMFDRYPDDYDHQANKRPKTRGPSDQNRYPPDNYSRPQNGLMSRPSTMGFSPDRNQSNQSYQSYKPSSVDLRATNASASDLIRRVSSHELVSHAKHQAAPSAYDAEVMDTAVRVHKFAKCSFCVEGNVDTQLRPCGHLFHGRCLKPWLQASNGPPCCLQCSTPISSCVFVITDEDSSSRPPPGPPPGLPPPRLTTAPSTSYIENPEGRSEATVPEVATDAVQPIHAAEPVEPVEPVEELKPDIKDTKEEETETRTETTEVQAAQEQPDYGSGEDDEAPGF